MDQSSYLNDEQNVAERRMPTRKELDRVSLNNPIFLLHATCHMCSFKSRALEIINLPPNLEGVDMESGRPTGVVRGPGILTYVHPTMGRIIGKKEKIEFLQQVSRMALNKGITTLHALDGDDVGSGDPRVILVNRDKFPVRIVCYSPWI
jgi:predicted amidohydrolase YtcJ